MAVIKDLSLEVNEGKRVIALKSDLNNIHINFIKKIDDNGSYEFGIHYPWDPKLVEAIKILNKRVAESNSLVLFDAYFLYHYYINPRKWHVFCKDLIKPDQMLISTEIQKIYGLGAYDPAKIFKPSVPKSGQWWTNTQQQWKSFYTQHARLLLSYKKTLQYLGALGSIGLAAWLLSKYKGQISFKPQTSMPTTIRASNPIGTANQP